jgi:hypothetical protein
MITIRPGFRQQPSFVISAAIIGGFCLIPVVFQPVSVGAALGLGSLMFMCLLFWITARRIRLEITETEVRAKQGGWHYQPDKEAPRSGKHSAHSRVVMGGAIF